MSVDLRVPQQKAPLLAELYGDDRRLFTTASALRAVCMWYLSTGKAAGPLVPAGRGQLAKRYEPMKRSVEKNPKNWDRDGQTYIRRQVTDGLRAFNLWISDVEFRQYHLEQSIFGHSLLMNILQQSSDRSNNGLIFAESIFGYEDYSFEKQLKRLLAFGGALGEGLSSFVGVSESARRRTKELCSMLNFGASIFDLLVDDIDVDPTSIFDLLGNGQLKKLVTDPTNVRMLNNEILRLKSAPPEIRFVLTTFSNLFTLLHKYRCESSDLNNLGDLFTEAYETELSTVKSPRLPCDGTLKSTALNKSVLLFRVMLQLACACDRRVKPSSVEMANTFSIQVGRLFALVDDFADLTQDALAGSVNSILLELDESAIGPEEWRSEGYRDVVDRLIDDLCHNLARICSQLEERTREEMALSVFRTRLLFYVRSWLE
jgi:hypothetical protein